MTSIIYHYIFSIIFLRQIKHFSQKIILFIEIGICLIQLLSGNDKEENVKHALDEIRKAVKKYQPRVVALPECFNAPYGEEFFDQYAEIIDPNSQTCSQLASIVKELNIYLVGGSIPERDPNDSSILYNTATVWSPDGELIAKHRKVKKTFFHL